MSICEASRISKISLTTREAKKRNYVNLRCLHRHPKPRNKEQKKPKTFLWVIRNNSSSFKAKGMKVYFFQDDKSDSLKTYLCTTLTLEGPKKKSKWWDEVEDKNGFSISELKKRQWRRQRHKFAYLVGKNNSFARPARAFFTFVYFFAVVSKTKTWNSQIWGAKNEIN